MSYSCFPVLGDKFQIAKGWERVWHHWWKAAVKYRQEGREKRWMNGGTKEGWNETGNERLSPVSLPVTSSVWSWVLWAFPLDAHTPPYTCQDTHTLQAVYFIHWLRDKHTEHVFLSLCLFLFSHSLRQPFTYFITHPDTQQSWLSLTTTDAQILTEKRTFVFITDCISLWRESRRLWLMK